MNSPQALAEYARSTHVPVCASETLGSRWATRRCSTAMPSASSWSADLRWTGGLTEARKIAALGETHHRPFAPHDCTGPIAFAAAIHTPFSQPNTLIQESVRAFYTGWYKELVTKMPDDHGRLRLPRWKGPASAPTCSRRSTTAPTSSCAAPRPEDLSR